MRKCWYQCWYPSKNESHQIPINQGINPLIQVRPRAPLFTRPPALLPKFTNLKYSHSRRIVDINLCDGFASSGENGAADPVRDECLRIFAGLNTEGKKRAVKGLIALFKINTGTVAGITGSILRDTSK